MKRARKSNRVSWAPEPYLRQVKFFYPDEYHLSNVGEKSQDHDRGKRPMVTSTTDHYDDIPPGFEGNRFQNPSKFEHSRIPQIKWKRPPMFALSNHWRVAAGENSMAKDDENLREKGVFEAMYPRVSAIPSSPYVSREVEEESYDDNLTPHIPIEVKMDDDDDNDSPISDVVIEEREAVMDPEPARVADAEHGNTLTNSQCDAFMVPICTCGKPILQTTSAVADLLAASAVVAAFMKCNEQLLKIFNDPIMMDKLIREYKNATASISASSSAASIPNSDSSSVPISIPTPEAEVSEPAPTNTVDSLLPASGAMQATPSVSLLTPTPEKDAVSSVSCQSAAITSVTMPIPMLTAPSVSLLTSKPATPSVPLSMPLSGEPAATRSLPTPPSMPTPFPPPISTPFPYTPLNKNIPLVSDGVSHTSKSYSPQQTQAVSSGAKQAATSASVPSTELNTLTVPSVSANMHAGEKHVRSTAGTVPPQPATGSTSSVVKDVNYYKNLILKHGSDKKRKKESHNTKPGQAKFKIEKQCKFFNSSKGCRNGSNCSYKHDKYEAGDVPVAQSAKRVKEGKK